MFRRTLIITPHFDDETIGCGGLISSLSKERNTSLKILVIASQKDTFNYSAGRVVDNVERKYECFEAIKHLGWDPSEVVTQLSGFEDGKLDQCNMKELVSAIDEVIDSFMPTAVLFPYSSHHQDHQAVFKASLAALRPRVGTNFIKLKAMYEYPYISSWSLGLEVNNKLYYPLEEEDLRNKEKALKAYESQLNRDPRDILSIPSIMTLASVRGKEIGLDYAEAFYPMSIIAK